MGVSAVAAGEVPTAMPAVSGKSAAMHRREAAYLAAVEATPAATGTIMGEGHRAGRDRCCKCQGRRTCDKLFPHENLLHLAPVLAKQPEPRLIGCVEGILSRLKYFLGRAPAPLICPARLGEVLIKSPGCLGQHTLSASPATLGGCFRNRRGDQSRLQIQCDLNVP